jgi:hypothetical protein
MADVLPESGSDGKALMDAWDYKGRPASRATTGGWACAAMTLGNLCRAHSFLLFSFCVRAAVHACGKLTLVCGLVKVWSCSSG